MARDVRKIIAEMTLEEKAGLCSGADFWHTKAVERLGVPSVMVSDGPHGLRKQGEEADHLGIHESKEAVCFPAACATASSFDVGLLEEMGEALGEECQAEGISVLLGPAANIKRSPLCGRNFEYFSEDPYLAGKMAAAQIRGVQKWDVGTSMKHFAANNQEYNRMSCSSEVSERTLREIYLAAFEEAVRTAQPKTIMCSYNKINGVFSSENRKLLTEILRDEWGFEGYVMTDWGAVSDRVKGLEAGLDLEMPSSNGINDARIVRAVREGELSEETLDLTVERILNVVFSYADHVHPEARFDKRRDHEMAVRVETESAVLLENNGVLPLKKGQKVAYIGEFAKSPRYQGGGSSHIHASEVTSAWDAAIGKGRDVTYAKGFPADADEGDPEEIAEAVRVAAAADAAVVFAGLPETFESEGYDRKDMRMPKAQLDLIAAVAKAQPSTVVVLHNGSPVECPWADDVAAVLEMYLGGQGVGAACDALLWGEASPCGRLAETFPVKLEDNPSYLNFPGDGRKVVYAEGSYVGYRYYEAKKMPVRWAFGHGLSYTEFEYADLRLSADSLAEGDALRVSARVRNVGQMAGKEVVQLYVADRNRTPGRPPKELRGFQKIALEPGEAKDVEFEIRARDLSYWDEGMGDWYAPSGTYEILVGHASDDIRLRQELSFTASRKPPFFVDWATTMGELLADERTREATKGFLAPAAEAFGPGEGASPTEQAMQESMLQAMPIKSLMSFGGTVTYEQCEALIRQMNGLLGNTREG